MTNYRKFMEPEYGEPAPEVIIYPSQEMDMEHLARWRKKNDYESVAEITEEIRHCICYPNLMKIDTEDVKIESQEELKTVIDEVKQYNIAFAYLTGSERKYKKLITE